MRFFLFVCCLLMGQINKSLSKQIPTTDKPAVLDGDQLLNIQTKLIKIQDDIISITAAMGIAETLENMSDKIIATEEAFQLLKEEVAVERRKQVEGECGTNARAMLNNHYNAVNAQLKSLQSSLKACREKRLPSDTIADIKGHRFELAEQKLKQMKNFADISKIFRTVYPSCSDNLEDLVNFVESLVDTNVINISVRALLEEMVKNNYRNPFKFIRLAKILQTRVLNQPNAEHSTKQSAQLTQDELKDSIRVFALEALNASVHKGEFERNGETDNLTAEIYLLDPLESESILAEFVNTNYAETSSKKILKTITSHRFIQQRARGVSVLFWKIKEADQINSEVTLKIASALHKILTDDEFKNLTKTQQEEVEKAIESLPACARNLFFLPSVCFWNREKEEYLTAGDLSSKYDNSRRNIFSADPLPQSHWYVNTTGDNFLFSSRSYDSEYLYAAAFNFNEDLRYVFNWIPRNNTDKQSEWSIELYDDYCYIKSAMYNEYMFSSNYKRPDRSGLRYVFTWVPGHSVREAKFQWEIRKCD